MPDDVVGVEPGDEGFGIVELMLVAALMSLIGILVATTTIGGLRTTARAEKRVDDVARAQAAMLRITADLRAAQCVLAAGPSSITVLTRTDGDASATPVDAPSRVTYQVVGRNLTRTRQRLAPLTGCPATPTALALTGTPTEVTLLSEVEYSTSGRAVFTMLSRTDSRKQCPTGPTVSSLGRPVAAADLAAVYQVEVWLSVNSARNLGARPVTVPAAAVLATGAGDLELDAATLAGAGIGAGCA